MGTSGVMFAKAYAIETPFLAKARPD